MELFGLYVKIFPEWVVSAFDISGLEFAEIVLFCVTSIPFLTVSIFYFSEKWPPEFTSKQNVFWALNFKGTVREFFDQVSENRDFFADHDALFYKS